jgi:hypothetical protein
MANVVSTRLFAGTGQYVEVAATAGNFRLSYQGQTTTTIVFNAAASVVQAALESLSTIGSGNVSVVLDSGSTAPLPRRWRVDFIGSLNTGDVSLLGISNVSLTTTSGSVLFRTSYSDGFSFTTANPTRNYAVALEAGTLVVIGYQNATNSSTAVLENSTDSAGNTYTVIRTAGSASQGSVALLWSRLNNPVTTSDSITLTTAGTQASVVVGRALIGSNLVYQNSATNATLATSTVAWIGPTVSLAQTNARNPSGAIVSVIGFENDFNFGNIPRTSPAGSTFLGAFDGKTGIGCSVAMAYRQVTSASYTGAEISNTSTGVDVIRVSAHWYELPTLTNSARTIIV